MKKLSFTAFSILLAGCQTMSATPEQELAADYGALMTEQQCAEIAEGFIRTTLKDPMSAQFIRTMPCVKGHMKQSLIKGGNTNFGYLHRGQVNAKNSYGGYVGFRPYNMIIKNGVVMDYCVVEPRYGICE